MVFTAWTGAKPKLEPTSNVGQEGLKDWEVKKTIFVSYAKEDIGFVEKLYERLTEMHFDVWVDFMRIKPGDNWKAKIAEGIAECRYFLAVVSRNSTSKVGYVQKELKEGLSILDLHPESSIFLIPIRIDETIPASRQLQDLQWVDMFPDFDLSFIKLLKSFDLQPGSGVAKSVQCTAWHFSNDDIDNRYLDQIQFLENGKVRFKNTSERHYYSHSPRIFQFTTTIGEWAQLGNGVTFRTYPNGPLHKGLIGPYKPMNKDTQTLQITSIGEPFFHAELIGPTDASRIGPEQTCDAENGDHAEAYELIDGFIVRERRRDL